MLRRKWLLYEGEKWVKDDLITSEQLNHIIHRYSSTQRSYAHILYFFATLLFSLGVLSMIASNWHAIPPLFRLGIMIIGTMALYIAGESMTRRNRATAGSLFTCLGVIMFGSGLILSGQMFQWPSHDARIFILWAIASVASVFLYRQTSLFYLSLILLLTGQSYSTDAFQSTSWWLFALTLTLGLYTHQEKSLQKVWLTTAAILTQSLLILSNQGASLYWLIPLLLGFYVAGDILYRTQWRNPFQLLSTFGTFFLLTYGIVSESSRALLSYAFIIAGLLSISLIVRMATKQSSGFWNWILFLPYFMITPLSNPMIHEGTYVAVLLTWSIYILLKGMEKDSRRQVNIGILLFLIVTLKGYFMVAWEFLPRSAFFLSSGVLLFILNLFLQRQKRDRLQNGEEEAPK